MGIGGGQQSSSGSSNSVGGFQGLSPQIQQAFNSLATSAQGYLNNPSSLTSMYTPLAQTSGETSAINTINNNNPLTNLSSNISAQMNPYQSSVIDQVNRNAYGANSALQQSLNAAGQFGSNRAALGANDIANSQASTIGSLLGTQYNTALNNALTTIPQQNLANASAQLQAGQFQRGLNQSTNTAGITGLQSIAQLLGILPTSGSTSNQSNSSSGWNANVQTGSSLF